METGDSIGLSRYIYGHEVTTTFYHHPTARIKVNTLILAVGWWLKVWILESIKGSIPIWAKVKNRQDQLGRSNVFSACTDKRHKEFLCSWAYQRSVKVFMVMSLAWLRINSTCSLWINQGINRVSFENLNFSINLQVYINRRYGSITGALERIFIWLEKESDMGFLGLVSKVTIIWMPLKVLCQHGGKVCTKGFIETTDKPVTRARDFTRREWFHIFENIFGEGGCQSIHSIRI